MEAQTNRHERWIRGKFDHFVSATNRDKLTPYVVARLSQVKAGEIFDAGLPEKVVRGVANVLVETAYSETDLPIKERVPDRLMVKRKFYTSDPEIIGLCQNAGLFYGKPMAKLIDDLLRKFDFDTQRAKEVLTYVGMRRGNDGIYDIYSMLRIATEASPLMKEVSSPLGRKQIMDGVLEETSKFERMVKEVERHWNAELLEMMEFDPEYLAQTPQA